MRPRGTSVPWPWSAGLPPASEDGGTLQSHVPGLCVVAMPARAAAGRAAIASDTGCGFVLCTGACFVQSDHHATPNSIAQVNAHGKRFQAGENWELDYPSCHGIELVAIILIKILVGFDNASLRQ